MQTHTLIYDKSTESNLITMFFRKMAFLQRILIFLLFVITFNEIIATEKSQASISKGFTTGISYGFSYLYIPDISNDNYLLSNVPMHTISYTLAYRLSSTIGFLSTTAAFWGNAQVIENFPDNIQFTSKGMYSQVTQSVETIFYFSDKWSVTTGLAISAPLQFTTYLDRYLPGPTNSGVGAGDRFDQRNQLRNRFFSVTIGASYLIPIYEKVIFKIDLKYFHPISEINVQESKGYIWSSNAGFIFQI